MAKVGDDRFGVGCGRRGWSFQLGFVGPGVMAWPFGSGNVGLPNALFGAGVLVINALLIVPFIMLAVSVLALPAWRPQMNWSLISLFLVVGPLLVFLIYTARCRLEPQRPAIIQTRKIVFAGP